MPEAGRWKRWFRVRFGLRTFLIGVTVAGLTLSASIAVLRPWYLDRNRIDALKKLNAQVYTEPRGQFLLRQFVGDSLSERSIYVHLENPGVDDEWLRQLGPMQYTEVLSIKSPNLTDKGLMELLNWPSLLDLNLVDTQVTDAGIEALRKAHPSLRHVTSRATETDK